MKFTDEGDITCRLTTLNTNLHNFASFIPHLETQKENAFHELQILKQFRDYD